MSGFEAFALAAAGLHTANTIAAGRAQARQTEAQAALLHEQADDRRRLAESREAAARRTQARQLSRIRTLLAGRGVDVASGSPLLGREQAAADAEFEALLLRSTGAAEAWNLDRRAGLLEAEASSVRRRLPLAAATTLLDRLPR